MTAAPGAKTWHQGAGGSASVDPAEIAKFSAMADEWWDPKGTFRPLHRLNPTRLSFVLEEARRHFGLPNKNPHALKGLSALDIGCGGGLLSEPLARLGAKVVGIDASERNITIAAAHARDMELDITYRATTAESLAEEGKQFDLVVNMEVVEHVADVAGFIAASAALLRPGGLMAMATLNRTPQSFLLAILAAEYLLRWLPRGTHDWRRFLCPSELVGHLEGSGLRVVALKGLVFNPVDESWRLAPRDLKVNYILAAIKPDRGSG